MKLVKAICILGPAALAALAAQLAAGQPARTDINPALLYYQAFLLAPEPLPRADDDYLGTTGRGLKLPEGFGNLAAGYDNQFALVRQAARATVPCDWGIDFTAGPATLLPHLARTKAVAVATGLRVMWALQEGRQADARDDLLGAFVLARNVARDGTLIPTLVQQAAELIVSYDFAENFGRFSPETLAQVAQGFAAAPALHTVAECVPAERAMIEGWLLRRVRELQAANPGDDAKTMAGIGELFARAGDIRQDLPRMANYGDAGQTEWWQKVNAAAGGTSEGVVRLVQDLGALSQRAAEVTALPPGKSKSRLQKFQAEIEHSPNPLIAFLSPSWERARLREIKVLVVEAMLRAAIEYKLHGEPGLRTVADPCGQGPFTFQRFSFEGTDRGFQLKSAYDGSGFQESLIFVEKEGPAFLVDGPHVGTGRRALEGKK